MEQVWSKLCRTCFILLCIVFVFSSHDLCVGGKLVSLVTDNIAVDTLLVYSMKQLSDSLSSGCDTELLQTSMPNVFT